MQRDTDRLLACASSGPRKAVLAQAQPRNGNGYGFSGIATFACRPTLLLALCILSTDVARIAGIPPREEPGARFRSDERALSCRSCRRTLPATRVGCSHILPLIGHSNFIHSDHLCGTSRMLDTSLRTDDEFKYNRVFSDVYVKSGGSYQ